MGFAMRQLSWGEASVNTGKKFRAFISYSQTERNFAKRLHRALETYRIPDGTKGVAVGDDRRIGRIFRDDDELGAAANLGTALKGAIEDSENLIVICSPKAAQSKWVNEEIIHFKTTGRANRIFAVVISGIPHCGNPSEECFPPALKFEVDQSGRVTNVPAEPLAIDIRKEPFARSTTRLVAGLVDLSFDDLWRRDSRRRQLIIASFSTAIAATVGIIALLAVGWIGASGESRMKSLEPALRAARAELVSGDVSVALNRLTPFLKDPKVSENIHKVLGWIQSPSEQLQNITAPALIRYRGNLLLLTQGGALAPIYMLESTPCRILASRDGRRLILFGSKGAFIVDTLSGKVTSSADGAVDCNGQAFETPSGLLAVAGTEGGPTQGSLWYNIFFSSMDGKNARVRPFARWNDLAELKITGKCSAIDYEVTSPFNGDRQQFTLPLTTEGFLSNNGLMSKEDFAKGLAQSYQKSLNKSESATEEGNAETSSLSELPKQDLSSWFSSRGVVGWQNPFTDTTVDASGEQYSVGCLNVGGDSVTLDRATEFKLASTLVEPQVIDVGFGASPQASWTPSPPTRQATRQIVTSCRPESPCVVVDGDGDEKGMMSPYDEGFEEGAARTGSRKLFVASSSDYFGLARQGSLPPPRGISEENSNFDSVSGARVYLQFITYNSGASIAVCKQAPSTWACITRWAGGEIVGSDSQFLRSPTGRYLYWSAAGCIIDLKTMRMVADKLLADGSFDFEPDESRFVIVQNEKLVAVTASENGWVQSAVSTSPKIEPLAKNGTNSAWIVGLRALGAQKYLSVRSDGLVSVWSSDGRIQWQANFAGLGSIESLASSRNLKFGAVVGEKGIRLFEIDTGTPLSGILPLPDFSKTEATSSGQCAFDTSIDAGAARLGVSDDGTIRAKCQQQGFVFKAKRFQGNIATRLAKLSCFDRTKPQDPLKALNECR